MDSLTQIVLGAAVGEAVAGRKLGIKAAFWGAIGGTIPDLDVFLRSFYDPMDAALVHRGFSHSLLFALIAGPILGYISFRLNKQKHPKRMWILLWFLSIVTHPMLDMFTNYGTQFLWPFSWRITFNSVFVIDPLYTIPFLLCLIVAICLKRDSKRRSYWNWAGIIYSSTYLLWGVIVKLILLGQTESYFQDKGTAINRTMVTPMPLTSFYWQIIAESDSVYYVGYRSFFADFKPEDTETIPKNSHLLNGLSWKNPTKKEQLEYITNQYLAFEKKNDTLFAYDLRFGTATQLTGKIVTRPIMGFQFPIQNQQIEREDSYRSNGFQHVDFSYYLKKIFGENP